MQLAAATAAKGTNRPIRGETCCEKQKKKNYIIIFSEGHIKMLHSLMTDEISFKLKFSEKNPW